MHFATVWRRGVQCLERIIVATVIVRTIMIALSDAMHICASTAESGYAGSMRPWPWLCLLVTLCSVRAELEGAWRQQASYELLPADRAMPSAQLPPALQASQTPPPAALMSNHVAPPALGKEVCALFGVVVADVVPSFDC